VGNVTLPTPVFLAGGALCVVAGYLAGSIVGGDNADQRTTAQVASFDTSRARLCLEGDAIKDQEGVNDDGQLCGTLRRTPNARIPVKGDSFRFVTVRTTDTVGGKKQQQVVIYGDVVG
jgi:hypothetical protein